VTTFLKIDQAGLSPAGTPGVSRTDGKDDGSLVTLENTGGGTTLFQLLWTALNDNTAEASLAATGDPAVWTFDPRALRYGTYLVELVRNAGLLIETRERRTFTVRTPGGLVIPALNERGNRLATLLEPGEPSDVDNNSDDWPDPALAALNFAAWWRAQHDLIMRVDWLCAPVRVTFAHSNAGGAVQRIAYRTIGAAFEAGYPSSHPSIAVYEIEPLVVDPIDEGPYTLDTTVSYIFRAARGRESGVLLPAFSVDTDVAVEWCSVRAISGGGIIKLFDCSGGTTIESGYLEMQRCSLFVTTATIAGGMKARDTDFEEAVAFDVLGGGSFERCRFGAALSYETENTDVRFDDCQFGGVPTVTFTADPGVVRMDTRTKYLFDAAGGSVTNGTITVEAPP
jgi:hypothetical protein